MTVQFLVLFTVRITHSFYADRCRDFRFLVPSDTARLLRNGRLLAKEQDGMLHVLCECDEEGEPRVRLPAGTLRIGLQLLNSSFGNFSQTTAGFPASKLLYTNAADPAVLAEEGSVVFVGQTFAHEPTDAARPVLLTLRDARGAVLATEMLDEGDPRPSVSFDLRGQPCGLLALEEEFPDTTGTVAYYLDGELRQGDVAGVVEVEVGDELYDAAPAFEIAFQAREEVLRYYLVAKNYTPTDFDLLAVTDAGFTEESRPEITFQKVAAEDLATDELDPALIAGNGERVVLFRSAAPLPRRERGFRRIQLSKNGDVLIANLPQPGADRAKAELIVHLSKP
ncbi:MAG: hypothetical protein JO040_07850 [Gemmatimonadetes bacterium]|nr:hypothetical protein [Gemmatimonadota bacterium]